MIRGATIKQLQKFYFPVLSNCERGVQERKQNIKKRENLIRKKSGELLYHNYPRIRHDGWIFP